MGGAVVDGGFEIAAHAHGEGGEAVPGGDPGEEVEMGGGVVFGGGDAHQALDGQGVGVAAEGDEGVGLVGEDAGLLWFGAGVHLDEQVGPAALLLHGLGEGEGELWAVQGFDDIGETHGVARLVGLQRADDVQPQVGVARAELRELGGRLLHAVLAEDALPGGERGLDGLDRIGLGDGDELCGPWRPPGGGGGGLDSGTDSGQVGGDVVEHAP